MLVKYSKIPTATTHSNDNMQLSNIYGHLIVTDGYKWYFSTFPRSMSNGFQPCITSTYNNHYAMSIFLMLVGVCLIGCQCPSTDIDQQTLPSSVAGTSTTTQFMIHVGMIYESILNKISLWLDTRINWSLFTAMHHELIHLYSPSFNII